MAVAACVAALAISVSTGRASLLVYEGYNGYVDGNLNGQTISSTTVGMDTTTKYSSSSANINVQSSGLSFGDLAVSGGSIILKSTVGTVAGGKLLSSATAATGSIYSSYLVRFDNSPQYDPTPSAAIGTGTAITGATRTLQSFADSSISGSNKTAINYGTSATAATSGQYLAAATTYMVLSRFTNVGSDLSVSSGTATLWVLSLAQFQNFELGGFNDAELDAAAIGSGATDVTSMVSQTLNTGTYNMSGYLQVALNSNSSTYGYTVDEIRFGQSLTDVIVTVPEPSAIASVVMGGALLLGATMRRQRGKRLA